VGTVGLAPQTRARAELRKMYLAREVRGRGLGKRLLDHVLEEARRRGLQEIWLETNSVLAEAIGLYRRYGFQPVACDHLSPRCDQAYVLRL
jgi:putative acetyltransferase